MLTIYMMGLLLGSNDNQLEINVSSTSDVSGLFDGGEGFDELVLRVDQNATNGVIVAFDLELKMNLIQLL